MQAVCSEDFCVHNAYENVCCYYCIVYKQLIVRGKDDEERQELGSTRNEEDDGESKEGAQGPWKPVPAVAVPTPPFKPTQVPEPGLYGMAC